MSENKRGGKREGAGRKSKSEEVQMIERLSPLGSGLYRAGSSPPSPLLLMPFKRFMATAMVSWASRLMEPNDMAPVTNRFIISDAGSTSSIEIGFVLAKRNMPRRVDNLSA